jgi:hypothetical protein
MRLEAGIAAELVDAYVGALIMRSSQLRCSTPQQVWLRMPAAVAASRRANRLPRGARVVIGD